MARGCDTPIDAFVLRQARSERAGILAEAEKRTLLRRATFDLTGLPPTPEEIESFSRTPRPTRTTG